MKFNYERAAAQAGFLDWPAAIHGTTDLSQQKAGEMLGCSHSTIHMWRRELGLETASPLLAKAQKKATFLADATDERHGTPNGYRNYACRCAPCTKAWTDYLRGRRHAAAVTA